MKKYLLNLLLSFFTVAYAAPSLAASTGTFTIAGPAVIQNMVAGSSQSLTYTLSTLAPLPAAVNVHCALYNPNAAPITADFNDNGCTVTGGVGVQNGSSVTVNLTLTVPAGTSAQTLTGVQVLFTQTNGAKYAAPAIDIPVTVVATSQRTVTFKNYCPYAVTFGLSSSAIPAKNNAVYACTTDSDCTAAPPHGQGFTFSQCVAGFCGGGACKKDSDCHNTHSRTCATTPGASSAICNYCASDSDCMEGSSCDTTNHECFWDLPVPTDAASNHYQLPAFSGSAATDTVTIPDFSATNGYSLMWGGGFAGRTGCGTFSGSSYSCKTAGCNTNGSGDSNGGCNLGEGFDAPSTLAEVTLVAGSPDSYDISIINGPTVPTRMYPSGNSTGTPQDYGNPYTCGNAGNTEATVTSGGTLGACSWDFDSFSPPLGMKWVDADRDGGGDCTSDAWCEDNGYHGKSCGLTTGLVESGSGSATPTCGTFLGYWSQNEICAKNSSYTTSLIDCTVSNVGGSGNSVIDQLGCSAGAATSCFKLTSTGNSCCGCVNWDTEGIAVPIDPTVVTRCNYPNANWVSGGDGLGTATDGSVLPGLLWMKKACPSAYSYPFDDPSSSFGCPSNLGQSAVDYTVEFCPPVPA